MMAVFNQHDCIRRLERLYCKKCETTDDCFCQVDYLICANDDTDETEMQFMLWLLGKNLQNVIIIFGKNALYILSDNKNLSLLRSSLNEETLVNIKSIIGVDIHFLEINEDDDKNEFVFKEVIDLMKNDIEHRKIGVIDPKGDGDGKLNFKKLWYQCLNKNNWNEITMNAYVANLMSIKDEKEMQLMKEACRLSVLSYIKSVKIIYKTLAGEVHPNEIRRNIDVATQVKNAATDGTYFSEKYVDVDWCYDPVIQSAGSYNLTIQSGSDEKDLTPGVIIISLGIKYCQLCSSITRTIFVSSEPNDDVKNNYSFLVKVHKFIIDSLRDGVELGKVYENTVTLVNNERPELVDNLIDNFGSAIGIQAEETCFHIKPNVKAIAKENMVFNVTCGFHNLIDNSATNSSSHNYSLWVGDTVRIRKEEPAYLTCVNKNDCEMLFPRRLHS